MSKSDKLRIPDYLEHIIKAIERIDHYTIDLNESDFLENEMVQDAVIRNIEIIGEAANNIECYHHDFAEQYSYVPWKDIYQMRNQVSHGYFSVDLTVVWHTIQNDLPELKQQIKSIHQKIGIIY